MLAKKSIVIMVVLFISLSYSLMATATNENTTGSVSPAAPKRPEISTPQSEVDYYFATAKWLFDRGQPREALRFMHKVETACYFYDMDPPAGFESLMTNILKDNQKLYRHEIMNFLERGDGSAAAKALISYNNLSQMLNEQLPPEFQVWSLKADCLIAIQAIEQAFEMIDEEQGFIAENDLDLARRKLKMVRRQLAKIIQNDVWPINLKESITAARKYLEIGDTKLFNTMMYHIRAYSRRLGQELPPEYHELKNDFEEWKKNSAPPDLRNKPNQLKKNNRHEESF